MDWFQLGKGVHQAAYCHLAYLTYMQSRLCEMPDWMKHKLESRLLGEKKKKKRLLGEISITSDMQLTPPYGRKRRGTKRGTKEPPDEGERGN